MLVLVCFSVSTLELRVSRVSTWGGGVGFWGSGFRMLRVVVLSGMMIQLRTTDWHAF